MLKILTVLLLSITQTHAASGDVTVTSGELSGGLWMIAIFILAGLIGLFLSSTAHKTYGKGESRKEFVDKMRKAGRKDIPSD